MGIQVLIAYSLYVLLGLYVVLVPTLILPLETSFVQSDATVGAFYFLTSLLWGTGSLSGGLLIERIGFKGVLPACAFLMGAGVTSMGLAPSWMAFVGAGMVASYGAGVLDGGINGLFLVLYPREKRGGALNALHLFFSVGAFVGPLAIGRLVVAGLPWQISLLIPGAIVLTLALALAFQHLPGGQRIPAGPAASGPLSGGKQTLLPFVGLAASIGLYVAAEIAVSNWLVKYLSLSPLSVATGALSLFWLALAMGRLLSSRLANRIDAVAFTVVCFLMGSGALVAAVLSPSLPLAIALFGLTGFFYGPIYPLLMTIGGGLYPHRLASLSGGLAAAAMVGSIVYPPLMGVVSVSFGLGVGMLGAGLLGIPAVLSLLMAVRRARQT